MEPHTMIPLTELLRLWLSSIASLDVIHIINSIINGIVNSIDIIYLLIVHCVTLGVLPIDSVIPPFHTPGYLKNITTGILILSSSC